MRETPPKSWQNLQISLYLIIEIAKVVPRTQIVKGAEIIIPGSRVNARILDLMVLSLEGAAEISQFKRSTITLDMPPPILVVEVVSPGKANRDKPNGQGVSLDRRLASIGTSVLSMQSEE